MTRLALALALRGDLRATMEAEAEAAETAVTRGMDIAAEGLKQEMRAQTRGAGGDFGKLVKTWRSQRFPRRGVSAGAAAVVFSKAPRIMSAAEEAPTIRARSGDFLAVPLPAAPRRGVGGRRISPATWPEHRFGPLRFVIRPGRPPLLVADGLRARGGRRGGFAAASATARRTGRGLTTVPMFVLLPRVRMRKRIDFAGAARRWHARLDDLIVGAWPEVRPKSRGLPAGRQGRAP